MLLQPPVHVPAEAGFQKIDLLSLEYAQEGAVVGIAFFQILICCVPVFDAGRHICDLSDPVVPGHHLVFHKIFGRVGPGLGGLLVLNVQNHRLLDFGSHDHRVVTQKENIPVKVRPSLLGSRDVVQIEHDHVLILKMPEPFSKQIVADNPYPVDLRRIHQGGAKRQDVPALKIRAV